MEDLQKKHEDKPEESKEDQVENAEEAIQQTQDHIRPDRDLATSSPYVGDVYYRGRPLFPNEVIWLNRDASLEDGEVTYMDNGKKKFTTPTLWNASIADRKYEIK